MLSLIKKAEETHFLEKKEIIELLSSQEYDAEIFAAADRTRKKFVGDEVHLRGLIEFSNKCVQNCLYCGLRRENLKVKRYRLDPKTIIELARKAASLAYKTVVLQSGEGNFYSLEEMRLIIQEIKKIGLAITLSVGEKNYEEYKVFREAGADRFLLRIETTDAALYENMSPGMNHANRMRCLRDLKKLGYEVGTGSLIGLPNQSLESLADDILFFKNIDADMIGVGPFIPNPDTPLGSNTGGLFELSIKIMALVRLLLPDINIPATTAMETLNKNGRIIALQSGANVVMPNVTEGEYRRQYALYPGKICVDDTPTQCRLCMAGKILSIGRKISLNAGFRKKQY